jgi:hypothetical protein
VLPRDLAPGETFRGTVVTDVKSYASVPGLRVLEMVAPLSDGASGRPSFQGLFLECGSGPPQPAVEAFSCEWPMGVSPLTLAFSRAAGAAAVPRASVPASAHLPPARGGFAAPPICVGGAVQVIEGPFSGARGTPRVEVDGHPATVIAQSPRALYWGLPVATREGQNRLTVRTGARSVSLPIWVVRLAMSADRLSLASGESTPFHAVLSGLGSLPESAWHGGLPAGLVDSDRLAQIAPGFHAPEPGDPGVILIAIENASGDAIALENSSDGRIVIPVSRRDVQDGTFRYDGVIRSRRAGSFAVSAAVLPLLCPVAGEEVVAAGASRVGGAAVAR